MHLTVGYSIIYNLLIFRCNNFLSLIILALCHLLWVMINGIYILRALTLRSHSDLPNLPGKGEGIPPTNHSLCVVEFC